MAAWWIIEAIPIAATATLVVSELGGLATAVYTDHDSDGVHGHCRFLCLYAV